MREVEETVKWDVTVKTKMAWKEGMVEIDMKNCGMTEILEDAMFPPRDPTQV